MDLPEIKRVDSTEILDRICKFRYQVYIKELGGAYSGVDHQNEYLTDELDEHGVILYAEHEGKIVGTTRMNFGKFETFSDYWIRCYDLDKFPDPDRICLHSKMMIEPEWRNSGLGIALLAKCTRILKKEGAQFCFLDCSVPLIPLYEKIGFRRYRENSPEDESLTNYVPLVNCVEDLPYYKAINSPFYSFFNKFPYDQSIVNWYDKAFPKTIGYIKESFISDEDLLNHVGSNIEIGANPLFENFTQAEILQTLRAAMIINYKKGERVYYAGGPGKVLYLLLQGTVELVHPVTQERNTLKAGHVLGESSFLNKTKPDHDAFVREDCQALIFRQSFKKKRSTAHLIERFTNNIKATTVS